MQTAQRERNEALPIGALAKKSQERIFSLLNCTGGKSGTYIRKEG